MTLDELWWQDVRPKDIQPVEVLHYSEKLWFISNRRHAALKMYQVLVGREMVWVRGVFRDPDHKKFDA